MRLSPDWVPAETRHHVCECVCVVQQLAIMEGGGSRHSGREIFI